MTTTEIEVMFSDLTEAKQIEVAKALGYSSPDEAMQEENWDVFPFTTFEREDEMLLMK